MGRHFFRKLTAQLLLLVERFALAEADEARGWFASLCVLFG